MKKIKMHSYLVIFLATLSLISVGFASWVASNGMTTSTNGTIIVEDVLKVNEYITCSSGDITNFSFFKTGFIIGKDSDGKSIISTTGTITAKLSLNIENCKSKFSDCNTLEIDLSLESDYIALFNSGTDSSISFEISDNRFEIDNEYITLSPYVKIMYLDNFNSISDDIEVTVTYTFKVDQEYYKEKIYPALLEDDFKFILSAKITGIVKEGNN